MPSNSRKERRLGKITGDSPVLREGWEDAVFGYSEGTEFGLWLLPHFFVLLYILYIFQDS